MIKSTRDVTPCETMEASHKPPQEPEYLSPAPRSSFGERFARNAAVAMLLLIAVVSARNARLPSGQTLLTAAKELVEDNWEDRLGKISFVSRMLPETVSVFFEAASDAKYAKPCVGTLVHTWSLSEPYLGYANEGEAVCAIMEGEVVATAHGNGEERIVRVRQTDGLETLYYNLAELSVHEGEVVAQGAVIGAPLMNRQTIIEVQRAGKSIDPSAALEHTAQKP